MGYDIFVYTNFLDDKVITKWVEKLKGFNLDCEIHPEFSFKDHSGYLPISCILNSKQIPNYTGEKLISGFELYIDDYEDIDEKFDNCDNETIDIIRKVKHQITINISSQDSLEFRLGMLSSAILSELLDGVVFNPQEGVYYSRKTMYNDIIKEIQQDDMFLNQHGWKLHAFTSWS